MLERLYTTKMSTDKKKLQNRFAKIRSESGRISRLAAFVSFAAVLLVMACAAVIIAANVKADKYTMTEEELLEYINRPIGAVMADICYADEDKTVFHYAEGLFIDRLQPEEEDCAINLAGLNIVYAQQGSSVLEIKVDKDGRYAYLSAVGSSEEVKDYEEYIVNLENGEVKKGAMPKDTELFAGTADTFEAVQNPVGWFSNSCIVNGDKTYYLTSEGERLIDIQLVTVHHNAEAMIGFKYVFGKYYVSDGEKKQRLIQETVADGEEILINSGLSWEANADTVKYVIDGPGRSRQLKQLDAEDGNYDVSIYQIRKNDVSYSRIYVIDNRSLEILFSSDLSEDEHSRIVGVLNRPTGDLYQKTSEYLEKEFHRVYERYYDIQSLSISNWREDGNEATFFYKMTYMNYNREPDSVGYIQEAKKRSRKEYEALYNDYLKLKEANHEFKVSLNGDNIELYQNISPNGTEWAPIKIDDYVSAK